MKKISENYIILGTNIINFSKYSRENIPKPSPKFKVGDKVVFTIETEITEIGNDCDGTVLYGAYMLGNSWGEKNFKKLS